MKKLGMLFTVSTLGLLVACGGGDKAKMKKFASRMCDCKKDKDPQGCAKKVSDDMEAWGKSKGSGDKKPDEKPDEDLAKAMKDMQQCSMDIMTGGGSDAGSGAASGGGSASASGGGSASASGGGSASASGGGSASASDTGSGAASGSGSAAAAGGDESTGVPDCDDYLKAEEKYLTCDKVPQQTRDALKASLDQQRQAFKAGGSAAAAGCKQGADAFAKTALASGC